MACWAQYYLLWLLHWFIPWLIITFCVREIIHFCWTFRHGSYCIWSCLSLPGLLFSRLTPSSFSLIYYYIIIIMLVYEVVRNLIIIEIHHSKRENSWFWITRQSTDEFNKLNQFRCIQIQMGRTMKDWLMTSFTCLRIISSMFCLFIRSYLKVPIQLENAAWLFCGIYWAACRNYFYDDGWTKFAYESNKSCSCGFYENFFFLIFLGFYIILLFHLGINFAFHRHGWRHHKGFGNFRLQSQNIRRPWSCGIIGSFLWYHPDLFRCKTVRLFI